ncbi:CoA ester lyase [Streptomyces sp. WAC05374]|uniref:HpcH/HpaI aldolase/citrate lyase family protein n=1 Tax=Streptomyces sp. WAC05374 TaxID=2487420 RepID=UPI000F85CFD3|nr:aldolase/citrate lyase family protein [Streptomyces sp. WAC05374]RST09233.1 CoA ester lyase [Streptomyces sp. WAC05374]TDF48468.1 CoA ester lyase [Streptomyces sp. WAC05374]TDF54976.1 CoA ester lyase [Streptomyces sp. WAC05374]TDF55402.1 CoA ester lyase [Streptomyces sp. WAC05374]
MTSDPSIPLTLLYAPGDRPEVVAKALASGADVVIVDLEDAVPPDRKAYALDATTDLLSSPHPVPIHVRLPSAHDTTAITALAPLPGLAALRVPKVTHGTDIRRIAALAPGVPLHALLESALAIEQAHAIATAHPAVRGIAIGEADLRADLGVRDDSGLDFSRGRVVVAARAADLPPPAQSVHPDIRDLEGLAATCAHGRALGFLGRAAIHPRQLPVIERVYLPTAEEAAAAEEIVKAAAGDPGALALPDGRFVDAAVVAAARRTLSLLRAHRG